MNILSIDPGTTTVGVSIFSLDDNLNIIGKESYLIDVTKTDYVHRFNNIVDNKLAKVAKRLMELLHIYKPVAVAVEMPFFNVGRPQAVIPLARSLQAIIGSVISISDNTPIIRPSPSNVKNIVGVKGNSKDKQDMMDAVTKLGLANGYESEHEIDAIAVNYYLLDLLKRNYMLPYIM